ncbi:hypothetical protein B566_EDAN006131 [Ephemera danica]|nr:hypothetical protein B566_EDAN006131 [Ephemera danica]
MPECSKFADMMIPVLLVLALASLSAAYNSHAKEAMLTDALLREVVDRMGKDLADAANSYLDFPMAPARMEPEMELSGRALKDLDAEEQILGDYGPLLGGGLESQQPSLRDQEFLQHSSLWGHQYVTGGAGEGKQRLKPDGTIKNQKEIKTDAVLPAYCNPPNPCPVGYTEGCLTEFENSASFSRDYQASQDCMCDTEHMFDCSESSRAEPRSLTRASQRLDRLMQNFQVVGDEHKSLVAKKGHVKKDTNPFLRGDKLPVAAKKGFDVGY